MSDLTFDAEASKREREKSIADVQRRALNQQARELYWLATCDICLANRPREGYAPVRFTTDRVTYVAEQHGPLPEGHERRVIGPVMRRAVSVGLIEFTGDYTQTSIKAGHRRPIKIYRVLRAPTAMELLGYDRKG